MVLAALLAMALLGGRAGAAEPEPWRAHANLIFRPVPQANDQPAMVLPTSLEQDADGFLWAGGETGLLRWDGYRFTVYTAGFTSQKGLPLHGIVALHRDTGGRLWVGTLDGNLARYDVPTDGFIGIPLAEDSGAVQCVWSIDDDGAGGLWVATKDGIFQLDSASHILRHLRHDPAVPGGLPDDHIQAILRDRNGRLWVGGRYGLAWADTRGPGLHFHDLPLPSSPGDTAEVSRLLQDSEGRIWAATRQQGAYVVTNGATAATRIADTSSGVGGEPPVEITSMAEVAPGEIWLATFGRGIVAVSGVGLRTRRIQHDPTLPFTLESDSVYSVYADPSGLTWVGTSVGLSLYNPGSGGIFTLFSRTAGPRPGPAAPDGVTGFDITAILARPDGGLWAGSEAGGVDILDAEGRNIVNLPVRRVFCMVEAGPGFLAGTRDGLYLAEPASGRIIRLTLPGRRPAAGVYSLYRGPPTAGSLSGDTIWLGGGDDGLWEFRLGPGQQPEVLRHFDAPSLTSSVVRAIAAAQAGMLAVGTDNGFNLIDTATGKAERILHDPADPQSLGVGGVDSFVTDAKGRLWAGTDASGISVMTGRDRKGAARFRHLGIADGLPNTDINTMLRDDHGRIWLSTDHGLAVVDPSDFSVRALTQADGATITAYWSNSGARTAQGTMVFGGTGGLTFVQPDAVKNWSYHPPIRITDIRLGGHSVRLEPQYGPGDPVPWLLVPPSVNAISAEFAALDYSAPERNRYRYRLLGFDSGWVATDAAHRVAAYTNLPPGDYTLQVEGSNRDGLWTGRDASLPIRVRPAWYQTFWFHVAEALGAGAAVSAVVQARTVVLRRGQRELQRLVDERTDELRASQQRLHAFAYVDSLTGLPNRRAFNEHMDGSIAAAARQRAVFALVLIDLDGFKQVNDTLGHDAGDEVLVLAASRLTQAVREGDFISRLGGDEFGIVLHGTADMPTLDAICSRVVGSMAVPLMLSHGPVSIGASLGAALFPQHGALLDELYKRADLALYEAKRAGKGDWRWYQDKAA